MENNIIIVGAGISGLTVAHYLIKKGYNVHIYEKSNVVGGMARSVRDKSNVPTEHSWRGYGPFYYNLFNLLKEIPLQNSKKIIENFSDHNLPEYTIDEISKHNSRDDLWTYYKGYVYDLTKFVKNHPGGNIILNSAGNDLEKVWQEMGYEWHMKHSGVKIILERNKIGKLKENMNNSAKPKSVYDNLSKARLQFKLLKDTRNLNPNYVKLSSRDYIFLFILFSRVVLSNERRYKYFKMRLDPILKKSLSYGGYLFITHFLCGPGYGFDKNTISVGHFGLFAYFAFREKESLWQVMNKPTNEAWFDPWVSHLKKLGVKFNFNSDLKEILFDKNSKCIGLKINNKIVKSDVYCIAINPFNLEKIINESKTFKKKEILSKKLERGNIVNNQISFRLGFSKKINFGPKNSAFVLVDSEYNITFYNQADHWEEGVNLGMNGKIKTLISGTLILPYQEGKIYNKPATSLKKEELLDEIVKQFKDSIQFNILVKNNNSYIEDHLKLYDLIVYREIFEDWIETPQNDGSIKLISKNLKWVNNSINEEYRLNQYYPDICKNLFFSGSHTKTSINIWSMEGSVESGLLTINNILGYYGRKDKVNIHHHRIEPRLNIFHIIDNLLHSFGLPNIVDVMVFMIIYIIIRIIIKLIVNLTNRYK